MRTFLLLTFFISLTLSTLAEETKDSKATTKSTKTAHIEGVVKDKYTGEALVGVKVQIKGTDAVAYTDFDGKYEFNGLKSETFKLRFDFVTYKTVVTDFIKLNEVEDSYNQLLYPR